MPLLDYPVLGVVNYALDPDVVYSSSDVDAASDINELGDPSLAATVLFNAAASVSFDLDLGVARSIGVLGLLATNLPTSATCTIRLRGSSVSDFSSTVKDTTYDSQSIGEWPGFNDSRDSFCQAFENVSARYWRVTIIQTGTPIQVEIGGLFLGPVVQTGTGGAEGGVTYGSSFGVEDDSLEVNSRDGSDFRFLARQRRTATLKWAGVETTTALDTLFALIEFGAARSVDLLYIHNANETNNSRRQLTTIYGRVSNSDQLTVASYNWWERTYTLRERLA